MSALEPEARELHTPEAGKQPFALGAAPPDADLAAGEFAFFIVPNSGNLQFKYKNTDGSTHVKTVTAS